MQVDVLSAVAIVIIMLTLFYICSQVSQCTCEHMTTRYIPNHLFDDMLWKNITTCDDICFPCRNYYR